MSESSSYYFIVTLPSRQFLDIDEYIYLFQTIVLPDGMLSPLAAILLTFNWKLRKPHGALNEPT